MDQIIPTINNALVSVPNEYWNMFVEIVFTALITSSALTGLKRWWDLHNEKIMITLTICGTMLAGAVTYLAGVQPFSKWAALLQGVLVFAASQPIYFLVLKPLFKKIGAWWTSQLTKVALNQEAKSAVVPDGGLPNLQDLVTEEF